MSLKGVDSFTSRARILIDYKSSKCVEITKGLQEISETPKKEFGS